jgi:N6-L-threonylcarbamoyladenine synthase
MPLILGIESTCDETAAAVVRDGVDVLSNVVATQVELHAKYRGVVPEIASRAHIENILPVIQESLANAKCELSQIDAIAVAHRPGLIGSLLIGVTAAKTLAWSLAKPLVGVDHVQAHLYSVMLGKTAPVPVSGPKTGTGAVSFPQKIGQKDEFQSPGEINRDGSYLSPEKIGTGGIYFPCIGLVVSGGHTALYDVRNWNEISLIGSTIDDAVGEAYDKVAAILGLGYPGGPVIDSLAQQGNPKAVQFPRSMLGKDSLDFSFSGLKTAVLYHVRGVPGKLDEKPAEMTEQHLRDLAASFQQACIDTIVKKLDRAVRRAHAKSVIVGGGVSANRGLRAALSNFTVPVHFPSMKYCTDNAAMSAGLAHVMLNEGKTSPLDLDAITYSRYRVGDEK